MDSEWEIYWDNLISDAKLKNKVEALDILDGSQNNENRCRAIYLDYENYVSKLKIIRQELDEELESILGVHLHTSRIKSADSLLKKVIEKRFQHIKDIDSPYSDINAQNYRSVLTDLIGIRLIISYRGSWRRLHQEITRIFPYHGNISSVSDNHFIPHEDGRQFIAEIPKAYYAMGDDLSIYDGLQIDKCLHEKGYRSVHYILSYKNVYVELQTRTIYDEAWSDCNHSYVYKHDENKSHAALEELSKVLAEYTNVSNDYGELMGFIFSEQAIIDRGSGEFAASSALKDKLYNLLNRFSNAQKDLASFIDMIIETE